MDERFEEIAAAYGGPPEARSLDEYTAQTNYHLPFILSDEALKSEFDALLDRMAEARASLSTTINIPAAAAGISPVFSAFEPYPVREGADIGYTDEQMTLLKEAAMQNLKALRYIADRGVDLRIGADAANGGEALLAELTLLVDAGFSPAEAFQIATVNGAQALGLAETIGRIEPGYRADLVMFDEDPFADIDNVFSEKTVIHAGRPYFEKASFAEAFSAVLDGAESDEAVRQWFESARAGDDYGPVHPAEMARLVYALLAVGRADDAALVYELAPRHLRVDGEAYSHLSERLVLTEGQTLINAGEPQKARAVFQFAARLFPASASAQAAIGWAEFQLDDEDAARAALGRALEIDPENGTAKALRTELEGEGAETNP